MTDWSDPLEWVKICGGFTGLVTFALAIKDRLVRNKPICSVIAILDSNSVNPELRLRVKNVSNYNIEVNQISVKSVPPSFVLSVKSFKDVYPDDINQDNSWFMNHGFASSTIFANSDRDFGILIPREAVSKADGHIKFSVKWASSTSSLMPHTSVTLTVPWQDISKRFADAHRRARAEGHPLIAPKV